MEDVTPGAGQTTMDIQLELTVLDPTVIVPAARADERIAIADQVWLRLLDSRLYARQAGPYVMTFALDVTGELAPAGLAQALWDFLRPRRGGRGVVTARMVRRREARRVDEPGGTPVVDRHELWFAIPLRSNRGARRQIDAFFAEVLQPA